MEPEVPGLPVRGRQGGDEPLADLVEMAGAGVMDLGVLLEYLLGGLVADLFLIVGAGRGEQPVGLRRRRHQQGRGGEARPGQRRPAQEESARLVILWLILLGHLGCISSDWGVFFSCLTLYPG